MEDIIEDVGLMMVEKNNVGMGVEVLKAALAWAAARKEKGE
jgi:hypothetical protein